MATNNITRESWKYRKAVESIGFWIDSTNGNPIADIRYDTPADEARAKLISAAPDMLFALQHIVKLADDPAFREAFNIYRQALPLIKEAIDRAVQS